MRWQSPPVFGSSIASSNKGVSPNGRSRASCGGFSVDIWPKLPKHKNAAAAASKNRRRVSTVCCCRSPATCRRWPGRGRKGPQRCSSSPHPGEDQRASPRAAFGPQGKPAFASRFDTSYPHEPRSLPAKEDGGRFFGSLQWQKHRTTGPGPRESPRAIACHWKEGT